LTGDVTITKVRNDTVDIGFQLYESSFFFYPFFQLLLPVLQQKIGYLHL